MRPSPQCRIVHSRVVIHQPYLRQVALPGVREVGLGNAAHIAPRLPERQVALFAEDSPAITRHRHYRAQVIGQQVLLLGTSLIAIVCPAARSVVFRKERILRHTKGRIEHAVADRNESRHLPWNVRRENT